MSLLVNLLLAVTFSSPVNFPISLAGNFGEPRPNHFHGGLDIKTEHVEGKAVHAIADGYVCRLSVSPTGLGNAVYVRHPDGHTSIYAHLQRFVPELQAVVRRWQYAHHCAKADLTLHADEFPVCKGQLLALSGNTGNSEGPHLHLEIHDSRSWNMLDPMEFIGREIADSVPPIAHAFLACPILGQGIFCNSSENQSFPFSSHLIDRRFTAWGKVGFALWANDYMQESYNKYGVRHTRLTVDGREVFNSDVNNIPTDMNLMVNSWGDYDRYFDKHVWYLKSFVEPGNRLPILKTDNSKGIVTIDEEREYHFCYELADYHGNRSVYEFVVMGKRPDASSVVLPLDGQQPLDRWYHACQQSPAQFVNEQGFNTTRCPGPARLYYAGPSCPTPCLFLQSKVGCIWSDGSQQAPRFAVADSIVLLWDKPILFISPDVRLSGAKGLLARNVVIFPEIQPFPSELSAASKLSKRSMPLLGWADLSLKCNQHVDDTTKLYIMATQTATALSEGGNSLGKVVSWSAYFAPKGETRNGWVTTSVRDLGYCYRIAYDNTPPVIEPLTPVFRPDHVTLLVQAHDDDSGLTNMEAWVDGQFVLMEPVGRTDKWMCNLALSPVKPTGKLRKILLKAIDHCNNVASSEIDFVY